jgi:hypothetical protein
VGTRLQERERGSSLLRGWSVYPWTGGADNRDLQKAAANAPSLKAVRSAEVVPDRDLTAT